MRVVDEPTLHTVACRSHLSDGMGVNWQSPVPDHDDDDDARAMRTTATCLTRKLHAFPAQLCPSDLALFTRSPEANVTGGGISNFKILHHPKNRHDSAHRYFEADTRFRRFMVPLFYRFFAEPRRT